MRCEKCRKPINISQKFCPHCGAVIPEKRKKRRKGCLIFGLVILTVIIVGEVSYMIAGATREARAIAAIRSELTELTAAKLAGNYIVAGKKGPTTTMDDIKNTAQKVSNDLTGLSAPPVLDDYRWVGVIWADKIAAAAQNTKTWKNLADQPGNFPLSLSEIQAQAYFKLSIIVLADLKKDGADAVKNKDRDAMRLVAAELLVQKHWLNGVLYSKKAATTSLGIFAQASAQVPPVGPAGDVTCAVCSDPKIKWTTQLWKMYNCDRCNLRSPVNTNTAAPPPIKINANQPVTPPKNKNAPVPPPPADPLKDLKAYKYKSSEKRATCIGNNVGGVFCVQDAVQSVNEIAASAIGFADGAKILSVDQWNNGFEHIDDAFTSQGEVGIPVSNPTAAGGHMEGGMGTINTGEPYIPPKTTPPPPTNTYTPPVLPPINYGPPPNTTWSPEDINLDDYGAGGQTDDPCRWGGPSCPEEPL